MRTADVRRRLLAARRKALGLTQEDLADLLRVDRSTVARWEGGWSEPLPWLRPRLAKALQVSKDQLAALLDELPAPGGRRETDGHDADDGHRNGPSAGRGATAVPRQLPASTRYFTGRAAELAALTAMLGTAGAAPGTIVISAIGGTAGVGKTALALHWAHRVADRFPGGQLYVDLRGFDPSGVPATPGEAIRGFLDALGVPPPRIPPGQDAQAGLYRSLLADRKMLILLDNAHDEQQVRFLLPASRGSLVIITSRNQLTGLAAADGARLLSLDLLSHAESVQLLSARLGADRAAAEPDAVDQIVRSCGCLPLALAVAMARAAVQPRLPLSALAAELRDTAGPLDALDVGDPATSVRAVFSWSYHQLGDQTARMFRLLGLHPGPDISVPAAASLAATSRPTASRLLRDLARAHLVSEHVPGRYASHDLLRAYAASLAKDDSEPDRRAAITRLLDHYVQSADSAAIALRTVYTPVRLIPPGAGVTPEAPADHRDALSWFDAEHHVLLAAIDLAAASGLDTHAWQLSAAAMPYLAKRGHYSQWAATQRIALDAATRLGDTTAQANCGRMLGNAYIKLGDYGEATAYHSRSLTLYRQLGNRRGEALVHGSLSMIAEYQGRYADALDHVSQSLGLYRELGDRLGEARTLNAAGWFQALLGNYRQARTLCRQGLTLLTDLDAPEAECYIWDSLGYIEHHLGNLDEAAACFERAISHGRAFAHTWDEGVFLAHLGDVQRDAGKLPQAVESWQRALRVLDDVGHPDADTVRAKLAAADGAA